jgi:hypothetical protein
MERRRSPVNVISAMSYKIWFQLLFICFKMLDGDGSE